MNNPGSFYRIVLFRGLVQWGLPLYPLYKQPEIDSMLGGPYCPNIEPWSAPGTP